MGQRLRSRSVDQYKSRNLVGKLVREGDGDHCAEGVADQNVGWLFARSFQRGTQFVRHETGSSVPGTRVAPSISRAIVGTDASELREFRLHEVPVEISCPVPVLENYRGTTATRAVEVQSIAAKINQLAGWMKLRRILLARATLIAEPEECNDQQRRQFNCKHDPERALAISCDFLISTQAGKKQAGGDSHGHS